MSATPGEVYVRIHLAGTATKGSYNLPALRVPLSSAGREGDRRRVASGLTVTCRALDRVFRAGRYWIPQWYRATHPVAYWDEFSHPAKPAATRNTVRRKTVV